MQPFEKDPKQNDSQSATPSEEASHNDVPGLSQESYVESEPATVSTVESAPTEAKSSAEVPATSSEAEANPSRPEPTTESEQPAEQPTAAPVAPPAKSGRSKLPFVVGGIVLGALLLGGGAFAAYRAYQSPEKVFSDAITKALHAKAVQTNLVVTSGAKVTNSGQTIEFKKFTFDTNMNYDPATETNATATLTLNGAEYNFAAQGVMGENGEVYFKIVNAVAAFEKLYGNFMNDQKVPADARAIFKSLENKWVKVSVDELTGKNKESADAYKCTLEAYKAYGQDAIMQNEVIAVYKKHAFMQTKGDAQYKDGLLGYEVTIDEKIAKDFSKAMKDTGIAKKVKSCDKNSTSVDNVENTVSEASKETSTVMHIWVDQFSHELKKLDSTVKYTPKSGDASTTHISADFGFDASKKIAAPKADMTLDEFTKQVEKGYMIIRDQAVPTR